MSGCGKRLRQKLTLIYFVAAANRQGIHHDECPGMAVSRTFAQRELLQLFCAHLAFRRTHDERNGNVPLDLIRHRR